MMRQKALTLVAYLMVYGRPLSAKPQLRHQHRDIAYQLRT